MTCVIDQCAAPLFLLVDNFTRRITIDKHLPCRNFRKMRFCYKLKKNFKIKYQVVEAIKLLPAMINQQLLHKKHVI